MTSIFFVFFLWLKVYEGKGEIAGMTLNSVVTYYLFGQIARIMTSPLIANTIGQRIADGMMQIYLLRPRIFLAGFFSMPLAKRLYQVFFFSVFIFFVVYFVYPRYGMILGHLDLINFSILLILGMVLSFILSCLLASSALWIIQSGPVLNGYNTISSILSGTTIPLAFFPGWMKTFVNVLPFRYMVDVPVRALQGTLSSSEMISSYISIVVWIICGVIINKLVWNVGLKKFDAVGN